MELWQVTSADVTGCRIQQKRVAAAAYVERLCEPLANLGMNGRQIPPQLQFSQLVHGDRKQLSLSGNN